MTALKKMLLNLFFCLVLSVVMGSLCALFLYGLETVTQLRTQHLKLVYLLPFAGLLITYLYNKYPRAHGGNNLLLAHAASPTASIPPQMAPMVFISTLITHLFGGSAGREGTAVQLGGVMSAELYKRFKNAFKNFNLESTAVISLGISSGFAGVFGTPITATLFAFEIYRTKKINIYQFLTVGLAAFATDFVCRKYPIHHSFYPYISQIPELDFILVAKIIGFGMCCGLAAFTFTFLLRMINKYSKKALSNGYLRIFTVGIVLVGLYQLLDTTVFMGLGIDTIAASFTDEQPLSYFLLKIGFTALTLGIGFKGGEVTPLFFIGACLAAACSSYFHIPLSFIVALGFVSVFAAAANTPLACAVMCAELFEWKLLPFALISCIIAYIFSDPNGIYTAPNENKYKFFKLFKL
ncbi:MAG: chloride channel protein [Flavobacterium sp.]|nr:chloride channel protein [Candidatus Neoflavobacterium equi]